MVGGQPMYGDFSGLPDYQGALNMVIAANEMFMALPSDLRTRFSNDPGRFIDFVQSASVEQLLELGLARPLPRGPEGPPVNIDEPGEELEPA
jgi:phage internal scaffolding protein